jgi:hypothetical protein
MKLIPDPATASSTRSGREDAQHQLLDRRPVHRRALQPRPAQHRRQGRGLPQVDRHRRHRVLRPRGRVLHLRRRPLRDQAERRLLLIDSIEAPGTPAATRRAATRATSPATRAATSPSRRSTTSPTCATRCARPERSASRSSAAPRGGHRRPGEINYQVRHAAPRRPTTDEVQVRHQEHALGSTARPPPSCRSRSSATTARACTPTSRCGRTASRCSTTSSGYGGCPTSPAGTSAACSSTRRRCWPSPTRR